MAAPTLSPPPLTTPLPQQDGTPSPTWGRWLTQLWGKVSPTKPYASYRATAGQSIPSGANTVVNFDTQEFDTDKAVATGAGWTFTVPSGKGGTYLLASSVSMVSTVTSGAAFILTVVKNGAEYRRLSRLPLTVAQIYELSGAVVMSLVPGDTLQVAVYQNSAGSESLETGASAPQSNWVTIQAVDLTG